MYLYFEETEEHDCGFAVVEALLRCGMWASLLVERWTENLTHFHFN